MGNPNIISGRSKKSTYKASANALAQAAPYLVANKDLVISVHHQYYKDHYYVVELKLRQTESEGGRPLKPKAHDEELLDIAEKRYEDFKKNRHKKRKKALHDYFSRRSDWTSQSIPLAHLPPLAANDFASYLCQSQFLLASGRTDDSAAEERDGPEPHVA